MVLRRLILGAVAASLFCGCGTFANLNGLDHPFLASEEEAKPREFGGVARDLEWIYSFYWPFKPLYVLDLPASLATDVITLPQVRQKRIEWDKRHETAVVKPPGPNPDTASESN